MSHQAAFDFNAETPEELSVKAGEPLLVLKPETDGWFTCRAINSGREGFVPASYVKEASNLPPPRRSAPKAPGPSQPAQSWAVPPATTGPAGPTFPQSSGVQQQSLSRPQSQNAALTKRGGGVAEIDRSSINYEQNLGEWRDRERRFKRGEAERLPQVKQREYYYWDRSGQRQGPFNEAEMRGRFDTRQVGMDTFIAPITTATGSEALPKMRINDYFPDTSQTFATAPIAPVENHSWMYLDDAGQVQGPFDSAQMREWFLDSFFNAETKAKLANRQDIGFVPLGVLFGQDGADAFLSDGDQNAATMYPMQVWPSRAPPPPTAQQSSPYMGDPFAAFNSPPTGYASSSQMNTYGGFNSDPFAPVSMAPPPPAIGAANPFSSPARSPSSSRLGLTPKAQSGRMLLAMAINGTPATLNPFEADDYKAPTQKMDQDDWGITWDDEQAEPGAATAGSSGAADASIPVPVSGAKEEDNRNLAPFAKIQRDYLGSHDSLYKFLTRALPRDLGTVRCKIKRSTVGMMHVNYNRYELFLEKDDGSIGPQILDAVKHKRMGFDSYFSLQIGSASPAHAGTIIAEVTMTTLGTQFLLHNDVKSHQGRARDLACIHYLKTGSGGGPRKMTVAIPGFLKGSETEFVEWPHSGSIKKSNLVAAIESLNFKDIQPLMNKPPVWSDKRQAWTLNFHGRVTRASVKNFQLVRPEEHDHVVLQHGRVGQDTFTMDIAWPMSMIQGLAVCLSSLHAKLGVE